MPRSLKEDTPDEIEEALWGVEGALEAEPDAADLAPQMLDWYEQLDVARGAVRTARRTAVRKRAAAGVRDGELDDALEEFSDDLLRAVDKDRKSPRFVRYFKVAVSRFKRVDRMVEATTVLSWKESLEKEPEPAVAAHAEPLIARATASRDATLATLAAEGERNAVRARAWDTFLEQLDAWRDALHADLVKRGQERRKPRGWADRFFETTPRAPASPPVEPSPAPTPA